MSVGPVEAAEAALAARAGGRALAIVLAVPEEAGPTPPPVPHDAAAGRVPPSSRGTAPGSRLLVYDDGETRGSLGTTELDAEAVELGRRAMDAGRPLRATATAAPNMALVAEPHSAAATLLIVGAGHIAVPLSRIGVLLGYRVVVLDDREDFATAERFPEAAEVRKVDFTTPFDGVALDGRTHVVLVTRAHRYDYDCLLALLQHDVRPGYIGMVGSRRRVRATFESLLDAGIPRDRIAAVHSPIGLDIGAETPEEIAVAIAAELVAVSRKAAVDGLDSEGGTESGRGGEGARGGLRGGEGERGRGGESLGEKERVLERLVTNDHDEQEGDRHDD